MKIYKTIYDDKKEKRNSIELSVNVQVLPLKNLPEELVGGWCEDNDYTTYRFDFDSVENANIGFDMFLDMISKYYNIYESDLNVIVTHDI